MGHDRVGPSRYSPIARGRKARSPRRGKADGASPLVIRWRVWISEREEAWRPEELERDGWYRPRQLDK